MPPDIERDALGPWCKVQVDSGIYPIGVVMKAAYWLTDRCYLHISRSGGSHFCVELRPKQSKEIAGLRELAGEFCNSLVDFAVRHQVFSETKSSRDALLRAAFKGISLEVPNGE
jgi:His-Xaa-Ser system protein HxsD